MKEVIGVIYICYSYDNLVYEEKQNSDVKDWPHLKHDVENLEKNHWNSLMRALFLGKANCLKAVSLGTIGQDIFVFFNAIVWVNLNIQVSCSRAVGDAAAAINYFEESVEFLTKLPTDDLEVKAP